MSFNIAQTFFIDPSVVQNASQVGITGVNLYFKSKPLASGNKSGILNPGVEVDLVSTTNSIPNLSDLSAVTSVNMIARVEYVNILSSGDSLTPTRFEFDTPILVSTGTEYSIIVKYDGNEDFVLWTSVQGDLLVGTNKVSPGPSGKYIGSYYTYISPTAANTASAAANNAYASSNWRPLSTTDLKFNVFVARYAVSGVAVNSSSVAANVVVTTTGGVLPTGTGNATYTLPSSTYEYILFDQTISKQHNVKGGEYAFQMTFFYPGGSNTTANVAVTSGSAVVTALATLPNGSPFNWNSIYSLGPSPEYIVVSSLNHDDKGLAPYPLYNTRHLTSPTIRTNVRRVLSVDSNTSITVDQPFDFSNAAAVFYKTAVGTVDYKNKTQAFGNRDNILILTDSNANTACRFVNNVVEYITLGTGTLGGSGYNNSDILILNGFEAVSNQVIGGYSAVANVVTNSTGGIIRAYLSNCGAGFVNSANFSIVLANSTSNNIISNTSAGSGANLLFSIGASIGTEFWGWDSAADSSDPGGYYRGAVVSDMEIGKMVPDIYINNPSGTNYNADFSTLYHREKSNDCHSGHVTHVDDTESRQSVRNRGICDLDDQDRVACLPSRSNEFVTCYSNGALNTNNVLNATSSNSSVIIVGTSTNNDFVVISVAPSSTYYSKFIINDDYSNENTNYGNALAKHISDKVNFANGMFAEDVLTYLTAYKPANTDIKTFVKIYNTNDDEAFDDKDWTLLEQTDGIGVLSSTSDTSSFIELTYGLPQYPNSAFVLSGVVTTQMGNSVVAGSGTLYQANATANLNVNDLVRIYQPLFPNNYIVDVITAVANDSQFTLANPISNNDLVGSGLRVDLIGRVGNTTLAALGYPLQAFRNITTDNVVRYYNTSMIEFDTYNTMQVKLVMLADNSNVVPEIDDNRTIGVSA